MLSEQTKLAIRYWEKRRLLFNALLIADAWIGWGISNAFNVGIDDIPGARITDAGVLWRFFAIFGVLNLTFCVGYLADRVLLSGPPKKLWPKPLRSVFLAVVCLLSMWVMGGQAGKIAKETAYAKAGVFGFGEEKKRTPSTSVEFALSAPRHEDDWERLRATLTEGGVHNREGPSDLGTMSLWVSAEDFDRAKRLAVDFTTSSRLTLRIVCRPPSVTEEKWEVWENGKKVKEESYRVGSK